MKKLINYLLIFAALILLGVGCQSEEIPPVGEDELDVSEESEELRTFSLTASMPEESGSTRIAFTQVGKDVALTWEEGDQLDLLFVQGSTQVKQTVTVNNISADGKRAGFEFTVPEGIEGTFDLYGVYGGGGLSDSDPSLAVLPLITGSAPTLESLAEGKKFMMVFSQTGLNTDSPQASVTFRHLGSLFCLTLKNASGSALENLGRAELVSTGSGWAYNSGTEQHFYNLVDGTFQNTGTAGSFITLYGDGGDGGVATNETLSFWGWYPPLPEGNWPELTLELYDKNNTLLGTSSNVKPARTSPTSPGMCYHFYVVWNDAGLHFTDDSYTAPLRLEDLAIEGDLRHAEGGDNFIGMVYTRSETGKVYYNQAQLNGEWSGEIDLGSGSDPRIAIDSNNNPHVVYVTPPDNNNNNKIAYLTSNGEGFTEPVYLESNFGGSCSKPDIAVDGDGFAHITYTDTKGNTGDYTNHPDIMYAVNSSGNFVKTLIYNGYYDGWEQSYKIAHYYNKGSRIAVDGVGQYYILTHHQDYYRNVYSGTDNTYQVLLKSATASGNAGSTYKYDREDIYDIGFDGTNVVAFYKTGNVVTTSELTVSGTTIGFANPQTVTTALSNTYANPATLLSLPGVRVLGGISSSNSELFVKYGTEAEELPGEMETVKSGTVAVVAQCAGNAYVAYTGSDGIIRFEKRE
jgi:hypothetical protein